MHPDLAHALERGWKIFPLIHKSRFAVSQPLLKHATDSVEQVELWQAEYPDCGWAVATGERSGIFALQISFDLGFRKLRSLCPGQSDLMDTLKVEAPGRVALFYQWPDGGFPTYARISMAPGIHLLQETHYVMLPVIDGGDSKRHESDLAEAALSAAPAWLLTFLFERVQQTRPAEILLFPSALRARRPVLLTFEKRDGYWHCRFLAPRSGREVCRRRRYSSPDKIVAIAERGGAAVDAGDHIHLYGGLQNGRGSLLLTLTPAQYERLLAV